MGADSDKLIEAIYETWSGTRGRAEQKCQKERGRGHDAAIAEAVEVTAAEYRRIKAEG